MFKYGSFRNFVIKFFLGIILFCFGSIYLVSLYTYSPNDPGYQNFNEGEIQNILGHYGAYLSSYSLVFIGTLSYLFALFLSIEGGRFILGIANRFVILNLISNLVGIISINISLKSFGEYYLEKGVLSQIVVDLISIINIDFLNNIFFIISVIFYFLYLVYF